MGTRRRVEMEGGGYKEHCKYCVWIRQESIALHGSTVYEAFGWIIFSFFVFCVWQASCIPIWKLNRLAARYSLELLLSIPLSSKHMYIAM
ncbi:uncharacterized protein K460DRAFT_210003 [Cucurbitaria berberidis CBS 394.84]|uniref:Uncharacterized protein n=1 Tax=Cucurbitaria berberidis CBS 394.84 TaxID=1168544 RepID=A0A9P4L450_9PLEO|nr:uncharacterized protein K460DRAFT_210003 [Cucurbitaria berberidis CBS 394.84]KAF1840518.1 hypothetical protein K460DRAFT_210003 [Cucurbitaria berberidis CBS 394.84]